MSNARQPRVRRQRIGQAVYQGRAGGTGGGGKVTNTPQPITTPLQAPVMSEGAVPQGDLVQELNWIVWGFDQLTVNRPAEATTIHFACWITSHWSLAGYMINRLKFGPHSVTNNYTQSQQYLTIGDMEATTSTVMAMTYLLDVGATSVTIIPEAANYAGIGALSARYYYHYWWT